MAELFLNLGKRRSTNPSTKNMQEKSPRHIRIKLLRTSDKEKILNEPEKKSQEIKKSKYKDNSRFLIGNNAAHKIMMQKC